MKKRFFTIILVTALFGAVQTTVAQNFEFRGVKANARYDDGETTHNEYLGWDEEKGQAIFKVDQGLWRLDLTADTVNSEVIYGDNLMYGNSGAVYVNDTIVTVYSRESEDDATQMEFKVRWWKASTAEKLREQTFPKSTNLESRGMSYNPIDGKVYGLFYFTDVALPVPDEELDPEDLQECYTTDAGYALATIDLNTMTLTQITPGIYYDNFVTLACAPDGRIFSMTSSGSLVEFDRATGLILTKTVENEQGELVEVNKYEHSGVVSQFKRQAACFDFTTGKMYWNGFVNSGMGYNEWGSYGPLSDKEWRTNGKYDTALYEVSIEDGKATRLSGIVNRLSLTCMWMPGRDASEATAIKSVSSSSTGIVKVYTQNGLLVYSGPATGMHLQQGLYIVKDGDTTRKIVIK